MPVADTPARPVERRLQLAQQQPELKPVPTRPPAAVKTDAPKKAATPPATPPVAPKAAEPVAPVVKDAAALQKQVDDLTKQVEALTKQALPPPPPPVPIVIAGAWYGDHAKQARCEAAAYRRHSHAAAHRCDFVCDAAEYLRVHCGMPLQAHVAYKRRDKTTALPTKEAPLTIKVGTEDVDLQYVDGALCKLRVTTEVCGNADPAPDSPIKLLKVSYGCGYRAHDHEREAVEGAILELACGRDK